MPPRLATRAAASARKRSDEAPFHCGSEGGKCCADVAVADGAEHRVGQGMENHVGIGMADQPARMRHGDAAQHDLEAGTEGVDVVADADAHVAERQRRFGGEAPFGRLDVVRGGELDVAGLAGDGDDRHAGPFGDRRVVGERVRRVARLVVRGEDRIEGEALRRLRRLQLVARARWR